MGRAVLSDRADTDFSSVLLQIHMHLFLLLHFVLAIQTTRLIAQGMFSN